MRLRLLIGLVLALTVGRVSCAADEPYDFAIIGDLPYNAFERRQLPALLSEIERGANRFVVHVGDIKAGSARCDDATLQEAQRLLDGSPLPLIYTPGDNEWADCHRKAAGGFEPLERLEALRRLFFASPQSLGRQTFPVARQSAEPGFEDFVENQRWQHGPVLFLTIHIVGGNNALRPRQAGSAQHAFRTRERANLAWLAAGFKEALAARLGAVVVFIHGNPRLEQYRNGKRENGYTTFLQQLDEASRSFPGQVVLVHGDTHKQSIELAPVNARPSARASRVTRIETHGHPFMGWVQVSVRPHESPLLRFSAHPYPTPADGTALP